MKSIKLEWVLTNLSEVSAAAQRFFLLHLVCISRAWYPLSFSPLVNPSSFSRTWYPLFTHNLSTALGILFLFTVICTRKLQFPRCCYLFPALGTRYLFPAQRLAPAIYFPRLTPVCLFPRLAAVIFFERLARCSMLLLRPRVEVIERIERKSRYFTLLW